MFSALFVIAFCFSFDVSQCLVTHKRSSKACQLIPSIITALCCVLRPHPSWVVAGHAQAPASSIFTLCFFFPDHYLGSRPAHSSDHTQGGRRTHLNHFRFQPVACSVELLDVIVWLGKKFLFSLTLLCFPLWPVPGLVLYLVLWNHNVICTCPA